MKTLRLFLVFCLVSTACLGDDIIPIKPITWRDAEAQWANGWCLYAQRCAPHEFEFVYGTQAVCRHEVLAHNCDRLEGSDADCDLLYPNERRQALDKCEAEMIGISCNATQAPNSCEEAF